MRPSLPSLPDLRPTLASALTATVLSLALTGCSDAAPASGDRLEIAVSLPPQAWLLREVGGDRVEPVVVLPAGAGPETFAPGDREVGRVAAARAYLRAGVPFEAGPWMAAVVASDRVLVADPVLPDWAAGSPRGESPDPHWWLDPIVLAAQAEPVAELLSGIDPEGAATYRRRAVAVRARLEQLHLRLGERFAPYAGRSFLVYHPSWGHFAARYGLLQLALESDGQEPSDLEMTRIARRVSGERLTVLFLGPGGGERSARSAAEALGLRVEILDPLAQEVVSNLERVAERLIESFGERDRPSTGSARSDAGAGGDR